MMLTPEQLAALREDFAGHNRGLLKSEQQSLFAHIDAQQARIAELEKDSVRLDFIERMAKQSRTGVGIDFVRHVEDGFVTDHGYRVMWHHTLNDRKRDMRSAIDAAMQK